MRRIKFILCVDNMWKFFLKLSMSKEADSKCQRFQHLQTCGSLMLKKTHHTSTSSLRMCYIAAQMKYLQGISNFPGMRNNAPSLCHTVVYCKSDHNPSLFSEFTPLCTMILQHLSARGGVCFSSLGIWAVSVTCTLPKNLAEMCASSETKTEEILQTSSYSLGFQLCLLDKSRQICCGWESASTVVNASPVFPAEGRDTWQSLDDIKAMPPDDSWCMREGAQPS